MRRLLLSLVVLSVLSGPAWATTYWVATTGSDGNACASIDSVNESTDPGTYKASVNSALTCADDGDTVLIKNGTYNHSITTVASGANGAPITIKAQNRRLAIFRPPAGGAIAVSVRHSYITVRGLQIDGQGTCCKDGFHLFPGSHTAPALTGIIIEDNQVLNMSGGGIYASNVTGTLGTNIIRWNEFNSLGNQAPDNNVEGEGMYLGSDSGGTGISGFQIYANTLIDPTDECFNTKPFSVNNEIHHNICDGSGRLTCDGCTNCTCKESSGAAEAPNTGAMGFQGSSGNKNTRVHNNIFRRFQTRNYGGCVTGFDGGTGMRFDHNVCRTSLSPSLAIGANAAASAMGLEIDNNTFCTLSSYAVSSSAGNFNIHNNFGVPGSGVAASQCDAEESRILTEMAALPGNPNPPGGGGATCLVGDLCIASGSDDAEERVSTTTTVITETALELGDDLSLNPQLGLFYFRSLPVPANSTCNAATITFTAGSSPNVGSPGLSIKVQNSLTPAAPDATSANISARTLGAASVAWSPASWTADTANAASTTPDLCTLLQPLFDTAGWDVGANLAVVISRTSAGTRVVKPAGTANGLTSLHLEYAPAQVGSPVLTQTHFRMGLVDVLDNTRWLAREDTSIVVPSPSCVRVRMQVRAAAGDFGPQSYRPIYAKNGGSYGDLTTDANQELSIGADQRFGTGDATSTARLPLDGETYVPGTWMMNSVGIPIPTISLTDGARTEFSTTACVKPGISPGTYYEICMAQQNGTSVTCTAKPRLTVGGASAYMQ
jgi:hypothetical protein